MMDAWRKMLVLLTIFGVATAVDNLKPGLRVKFGNGANTIGETHFLYAPITVSDAIEAGWVLTKPPAGPLPQLVMYCYPDKNFCCYFDDTGYIAGNQVAIPENEFSDNVFDWEKRGFTSWVSTVNGQCKRLWAIREYYVDNVFLSRCKKERIANRDSNRLLQAGAVWFTGTDGNLLRVSNKETEVAQENLFTKQSCLPQMGQHYYYNMSKLTECTYDQMYPWGVMFTNGELSTTVFFTYGKLKMIPGERNWFERANGNIARTFIPNGPECLYEYSDNPGIVSVHIYFVSNPEVITCPTY